MERNGQTLTQADRDSLRAVLPWLQSQPKPILKWNTQSAIHYPDYDPRVDQVAQALGSKFWIERDYHAVLGTFDTPIHAATPELIATMTLEQLCAAITAFHRGDRFADGFMGRQIESGAALALVQGALEFCDSVLG